MKNFAIPTLLVATVMVAGMFAFMPVEQASTVHTSGTTTLAASASTDATNISFDTLYIGDPVTFGDNTDLLVLVDLHEAVADGFVLLRTDTNIDCTLLQVVQTTAGGAQTGAAAVGMTELTGAAEAGGFFEALCHGHIPNGGANAVLVAIQATAAEVIPAHSSITTTIEAIVDATVAG